MLADHVPSHSATNCDLSMPLPSSSVTTPQTSDAAAGAKAKSKKRVREPSALPPTEGTLRSFSLKVCHAVHAMGMTSYNQVADQLVTELLGEEKLKATEGKDSDERNIRRSALATSHRLSRATALHARHGSRSPSLSRVLFAAGACTMRSMSSRRWASL